METEEVGEVGGVGEVGEEMESEWEEEWITEESSKEPDRESTVPMYNYFRKEPVPSSITSPVPSLVTSVPIYEARIVPSMYNKSENPVKEVNNWSQSNLDTINKWQNDIQKSSFIYGQVLEGKEFYIQLILILTLFFGGMITILAGVSVAVSLLDTDPTWITFSFSLIITIFGSTITGLNGVIKIFHWDEDIKSLTKIIEKLDDLWFVFETEMNIDVVDRENGKVFIKRMDGEYMSLMQLCPHLSLSDYVKANQSYQERLSKNLIWQKMFNQKITIEENKET